MTSVVVDVVVAVLAVVVLLVRRGGAVLVCVVVVCWYVGPHAGSVDPRAHSCTVGRHPVVNVAIRAAIATLGLVKNVAFNVLVVMKPSFISHEIVAA